MKQNNKKSLAKKPAFHLSGLQLFCLLAGLLLITFYAFSPVLKNGFTNWDDNGYVFQNPHLAKPLPEAIKFFFSPNYFIGNYIPITMLLYAWEYHTAGFDAEFFHLTNLILHLANVLLVFCFVYLLSEKKIGVAGFVAIFFAIHPMHVESVAWIAELKDVTYTFFFIAGLIAYYRHLHQKTMLPEKTKNFSVWLLLSFVLFILSVFSKPAAIVFPLVALALDFYVGRKFNTMAWLEKIPFVIVSAIFGYIAVVAQKSDQLLHSEHSLIHRLLFASHSFVAYVWKLFLPTGLSNFYPYPAANEPLPFYFYLAPLVVLAGIYLLYRTLKHSRLYVFGFLFFTINLLLVLQIISIGDAIMADRYTYVPYIGLLFILGILFERILQIARYRLASLILVSLLVIICLVLTQTRTKVWNNDDSIATDLLEKYPNDRLALNNKGFILLNQGRLPEAVSLFEKALLLKPDYTRASINLLNAQLELRETDKALNTVNQALTFEPENINLVYARARILLLSGKNEEAIVAYKKALTQSPSNINIFLDLMQCYYNLGNYSEAIRILDQALVISPKDHVLLNNKGYMLFSLKRYTEALSYYKQCLAIQPDYSIAQVNLKDCEAAMKTN